MITFSYWRLLLPLQSQKMYNEFSHSCVHFGLWRDVILWVCKCEFQFTTCERNPSTPHVRENALLLMLMRKALARAQRSYTHKDLRQCCTTPGGVCVRVSVCNSRLCAAKLCCHSLLLTDVLIVSTFKFEYNAYSFSCLLLVCRLSHL